MSADMLCVEEETSTDNAVSAELRPKPPENPAEPLNAKLQQTQSCTQIAVRI